MSSPERDAARRVIDRIHAACERVGRDPGSVTLVAASKTVEPERIAASGVIDVGENRVQEMLPKQEALAGANLRWHFIGALQRNKVAKVAGRVVLIHSVDSLPLAEAIDRSAHDLGIVQRMLIEVNASGEPSKSGVEPAAAGSLAEACGRLRHVEVTGLMTVPAPGESGPAFARVAALARSLGMGELSMGMSDDFEDAIEAGATIVRVGSAIFGARSRRTSG